MKKENKLYVTSVGLHEKMPPFSISRKERERNQGVLSQGAEAIIYLVSPKTVTKKNFSLKTSSGGWRGGEALVANDFACNPYEQDRELRAFESEEQFILKSRIPKPYRIKILDDKIRKSRTKSEIKLLTKASSIINVPSPIEDDCLGTDERGSEITQIKMPFIEGKKLSEHLNNFPEKEQEQICLEIGKSVAKLHQENIIHGDLTTSNMILVEKDKEKKFDYDKSQNSLKKNMPITNSQRRSLTESASKPSIANEVSQIRSGGRGRGGLDSEPIIFFIDFGLGFISHKLEDKAVDLHLLKQALEAKHFQNWGKLFEAVIQGYSKFADSKKVLERLRAVEKRGRYKH